MPLLYPAPSPPPPLQSEMYPEGPYDPIFCVSVLQQLTAAFSWVVRPKQCDFRGTERSLYAEFAWPALNRFRPSLTFRV